MIAAHMATILWVTGIITAVPVVQFLLPRTGLRLLSGLSIEDEGGRFFARHWGLCCASIGALLCYAATAPAARSAIVGAVVVEKLGLVALVALSWNRPFARGLRLSAGFDALCSAVYLAYLLGG